MDDKISISEELSEYSNNAFECIEKIKNIVNNSNAYFKGTWNETLINRFNEIMSIYPSIKESIKNYIEEIK